MKIRTDFVTNSSSSSFVIAVHKDVTKREARELVEKHFENVIIDALDADEEHREEIVSDLVSVVMTAVKSGMKIGDWRVDGGAAYSEDGGASYVFHMSGNFEAKRLKYQNSGY